MRHRQRWFIAVNLAAVVCLGSAGLWFLRNDEMVWGSRVQATYPRIVLVTFDTLNVWYTSLFSDDPEATPNLQELATSGVLFEQARTVVPQTLPSHTSLLSGRTPWDTRVMANGDHVLDSIETLPEILHAHGFRTAAFLSLGVLNPAFNLVQGFDEYDAVQVKELGRWYRTADEVTEAALSWMERHADQPFFVWIHLSDPHAPYVGKQEPPDTELLLDGKRIGLYTLGLRERHSLTIELPRGRHRLTWHSLHHAPHEPTVVMEVLGTFELGLRSEDDLPEPPFERRLEPSWSVHLVNPEGEPVPVTMSFGGHLDGASTQWSRGKYRGEVRTADHYFGVIRRWFDERGLDRKTLWIIASDHGEGLGHGGSYGHGASNREEQLRTLLLFRGPKVPRGRRLGAPPVLLIDALPTLLDVLGLDPPQGLDGRSLIDCWGPTGCRPPRGEWPSYGVDKKGRLRSASIYRWPFKVRWKRLGTAGIFDLTDGPRERDLLQRIPTTLEGLRDAPGTLPPGQAEMVESLVRQIDALAALVDEAGGRNLDPEQREMLRSLGYL